MITAEQAKNIVQQSEEKEKVYLEKKGVEWIEENLFQYVKKAAQEGKQSYVFSTARVAHLKISPYICAELEKLGYKIQKLYQDVYVMEW